MAAPRASTQHDEAVVAAAPVAEGARLAPRADGDPGAAGTVLHDEVGGRQVEPVHLQQPGPHLAVARAGGTRRRLRRPSCASRKLPSRSSAMPLGRSAMPSGPGRSTGSCCHRRAGGRRRRASRPCNRSPAALASTHSGRTRPAPTKRSAARGAAASLLVAVVLCEWVNKSINAYVNGSTKSCHSGQPGEGKGCAAALRRARAQLGV